MKKLQFLFLIHQGARACISQGKSDQPTNLLVVPDPQSGSPGHLSGPQGGPQIRALNSNFKGLYFREIS